MPDRSGHSPIRILEHDVVAILQEQNQVRQPIAVEIAPGQGFRGLEPVAQVEPGRGLPGQIAQRRGQAVIPRRVGSFSPTLLRLCNTM